MKAKKIISALLAITMLFSMMGLMAFAEGTAVASIGETNYSTLAEALAAAETGEDKNITVSETIVLDQDGTLDLKGATINAASTIENAPVFRVLADVTVTNGIVDGTSGINCYAFIVGNSEAAGALTIADGTYIGVTSAISITNGTVNISGGTFQTGHDGEGTDYGTTYLLNCMDAAYNSGDAKFNITGGTFVGFNPANNAAEGEGTNFLSEDHQAVENEDGTWGVSINYIKWIKAELLAGRNVTLDRDIVLDDISYVEALHAASNGDGKYCGFDYGNGAFFNVIGGDMTFDLNGHSITYNIHDDAWCNKRVISIFYVTDKANLTITDSVGTGAVTVNGMASAVYSVAADTKVEITGGTWTWNPCENCDATNIFLYASHGGELYINDGSFDNNVTGDAGEYMIMAHYSSKETTENSAGVDYDSTKIAISGGTFYDYNPGKIKYMDNGNNNAESMDNGCLESYEPVENADGSWGVVAAPTVYEVATKAELDDALAKVKDGDTIRLTADIDYGTNQLKIEKAITLDLGERTLTNSFGYGGISLKNNPTIKNGTIDHKGGVAAIKAWNVASLEDLTITVAERPGKTVGGIVIQEGSDVKVGTIKNVTINGAGLTNGIETYNCGTATENVIGSMENVTIDAVGTGMLISAPCGTATNCDIKGGATGIEIWIKGTYSASLNLVDCVVEGGTQAVYAHDEFNSNPGTVNNGTITLTVDEETTFVSENGDLLALTIARINEETQLVLPERLKNFAAKVENTYYTSLKDAVNAANEVGSAATVTLLKDVTLGEKLTISGDVTIEGAYTITRDDAYTGTLFAVNAGATLTLDGGLTIDGGNAYVFNAEAYAADLADWENNIATADNAKWFTPEAGAPVATAYMITTSGTINLNNVTIENHYSTNGSGIVSAGKGAIVTLTGAQITHNASTSGSGLVVNASGGVWSREEELITVVMNDGTVIDGNHVGGNHGIFKIYMGTYFTMNGGEVKNTTGWNSNGTAVGIYHAVFTMNGGKICSNSSVYGPNNGRNAAIYGHSNHLFTMNGGTICHNTGRSKAGIDSPYSETGYTGLTVIRGGSVLDNTVIGPWTAPDVSGGATLTVTGGTFTQDVTAWLAPDSGLVYNEETGTYSLTQELYKYNDKAYKTLADVITAIKATPATLDDGETTPVVTVLASHKVDDAIVIDTDLILDLGGKTITGAKNSAGVQVYPVIRVVGGANVTVRNGEITNGDYVFVLGSSDGTEAGNLTIESGKYHGQTTVASVTKGTLTINGGEFSVDPYIASEGAEPNYNFLLNCIDGNYKDGSAKIVVNGGSFYHFDPSNNAAEGTGTKFTANDTKVNVNSVDNLYKVVKLDPRTITLKPSKDTVKTNEEFTVDVMISGVEAKGAKWALDFEEEYFEYVSMTKPAAYTQMTTDELTPDIIAETGTIDTTTAVVTYIFKAKTTAVVDSAFTLSNVDIRTVEDAWEGTDVTGAIDIQNTDVTIALRSMTAKAYNGEAEVTDGITINHGGTYSVSVKAFEETAELTDITVTYTVNGKEVTEAELAAITDVGTYTIGYTVSKEGYEDATGTFVLTINYNQYTVTATLDGEEVTSDTTFAYDGADHTFTVEAAPEATITYSVNGGNPVSEAPKIKGVGTYEITYTIDGAVGYEKIEETVTITVTDDFYKVEVLFGENSDYVDGTKLVLVYTHVENVSFDFGGVKMLDASGANETEKGYLYQNTTKYAHVYALVVEALPENELSAYEALVKPDYENGAAVIDYNPVNDINFSKTVTWDDIMAAYSVVEKDEYAFINQMAGFIKADTNRDKHATSNDVTPIITEVYGTQA